MVPDPSPSPTPSYAHGDEHGRPKGEPSVQAAIGAAIQVMGRETYTAREVAMVVLAASSSVPPAGLTLTPEEIAAVLERIDWPKEPFPELVSGRDKLYDQHGLARLASGTKADG